MIAAMKPGIVVIQHELTRGAIRGLVGYFHCYPITTTIVTLAAPLKGSMHCKAGLRKGRLRRVSTCFWYLC